MKIAKYPEELKGKTISFIEMDDNYPNPISIVTEDGTVFMASVGYDFSNEESYLQYLDESSIMREVYDNKYLEKHYSKIDGFTEKYNSYLEQKAKNKKRLIENVQAAKEKAERKELARLLAKYEGE